MRKTVTCPQCCGEYERLFVLDGEAMCDDCFMAAVADMTPFQLALIMGCDEITAEELRVGAGNYEGGYEDE